LFLTSLAWPEVSPKEERLRRSAAGRRLVAQRALQPER
jgi:hypothetical protein